MREGNSFWQRGTASMFHEEMGSNMNTRQGYGDRNRQFSASDADNEQGYCEQNFEDRDRRNNNFDRERRGQNFNREGHGQNYDREGRGQNFEREGRGHNFEREGKGQNFERDGRGQNFERDNRGQNFEEREGRYDGSRGMGSHPNEVGPRSIRGDGIGSSNSRSSSGMGPHNSGPPGGMGPNQSGGFNGMGPNQPGGFSGMGPQSGGFPGMGPTPPIMPGGGMNMPRPVGGGGGPQPNFGGGNNSEVDIVSSFQSLSQMTSQSDIATKILSAVLSSVPNFAGNPLGNPMNLSSGNIPFPGPVGPGPMGMNSFNNQSGSRPFRNNMNKFEDRRAYPRRSSPPRSRRFSGSSRDRFKDDRRGKRSSISSSRGNTRGRFDRSPDIKKRLDYKSSKRERDDKVKSEPLNSKRRRLSGEKTDSDKKKEVHSKETVAKSKRSDTEDESKSSDGKLADEEKNKEEGISEVKKKKWVETPAAALFCHICNQGKFSSEQTYLYHLEGVRHKKTANSFWDKNDATLEYLRKNAKLASIRFGGFDNSFTPSTCNICFAVVKESFKNHKRLLEHKLVSRFLMPRCCGRRFKSRHDMDEHRLSLPHLRKIYEKNQAKNVALEESENQGNTTFKEVMSQLQQKITADMEEINLLNMPPFDGNQMIGVNFLEPKESVLCKPCQMLLPIGAKSLEGHLVSLSHYNAMQEYLITNKGKENKDKDDKINADGSTATSTTNTKLKRERGERDSDEEDSDDDDLARHIALSEAEDDDDLPFIDESNHIVLEEVDENDDKDKSNEKKAEDQDEPREESEPKDETGEEDEPRDEDEDEDEHEQRDEDEPRDEDEQRDEEEAKNEEQGDYEEHYEETMDDEEVRDDDADSKEEDEDLMDEAELIDE